MAFQSFRSWSIFRDYNVTLCLLDKNGNTASDQHILHIVEPSTTPETADPTLYLILGGVGIVAVIVIVVFAKRR
jgi:hypothetical protein